MACPDFDILIDYADGRLEPAKISSVKKHLTESCGDCGGILDWYASFVATAREDVSVEPPVWVTERAIGLFADARKAASERGLRGLVSRLRAALVFDSLAGALTPDAIAARTAVGGSRQLLYSAAPYDVDLLIAAGEPPQSLTVTGQVLTSDGDDFESVRGLTVTVERDGQAVTSAETSDFGEFTLAGVAPGLYDLRFASDEREIVIAATPLSLD